MEGYIWNCNIEHASTTNIENEIESLIGSEKKEQFFDLYRKNYITEYEISLLADHGFNAIRVPLHYKHFSPSYGTFTNIGFDLLQINTDDDYIKFLMQFFRSRAKRN